MFGILSKLFGHHLARSTLLDNLAPRETTDVIKTILNEDAQVK